MYKVRSSLSKKDLRKHLENEFKYHNTQVHSNVGNGLGSIAGIVPIVGAIGTHIGKEASRILKLHSE